MKIEDFSTKEDLMCGLLVSINNRLTMIYDLMISYIVASNTPVFMHALEKDANMQAKVRFELEKLKSSSFVCDEDLESDISESEQLSLNPEIWNECFRGVE